MEFHEERIRKKKNSEKIVMLTAYDYQIARILDEVGIDLILVGDSLGMVVQGLADTKSVTMEDMIYHTRCVARGAKNTPIVGDMPINSCNTPEEGLANAKRFLEVGAHAVKIEGNKPEVIRTLREAEIPVMGHVGMLPQTAQTYQHVSGKSPQEAEKILGDSLDLDRLGVFSMVLESVPESLAKKITQATKAPTIGIGAGNCCDGQVLVINDMLGLDPMFKPKFLKRFADLNSEVKNAVSKFKEEVTTGAYPDSEHSYH